MAMHLPPTGDHGDIVTDFRAKPEFVVVSELEQLMRICPSPEEYRMVLLPSYLPCNARLSVPLPKPHSHGATPSPPGVQIERCGLHGGHSCCQGNVLTDAIPLTALFAGTLQLATSRQKLVLWRQHDAHWIPAQ